MLLVTLAIGAPQAMAQNCHVNKGDSIWRIAKEYHLSFHRLMELNRHLKNPNLIHPGQHIETHIDKGQGNDQSASNGSQDGPSSNENNVTTGEQSDSSEQAKAVLALVNAERSKQGLKALQLDQKLNEIATVKAKDMAENDYFSHDSPTYGSPFEMMRSFGVTQYRSAGENIAAGQKTPEEVMHSWMNSSGHRANILSASYTHLGVGYVKGGSYGTYWVQEFTQQ